MVVCFRRPEPRDNIQSNALVDVCDTGHPAGVGRILSSIRRNPAELLRLATNVAGKIQSPRFVVRVERQCLERDFYFCNPAFVVTLRHAMPDAIPLPVLVGNIRVYRLISYTVCG